MTKNDLREGTNKLLPKDCEELFVVNNIRQDTHHFICASPSPLERHSHNYLLNSVFANMVCTQNKYCNEKNNMDNKKRYGNIVADDEVDVREVSATDIIEGILNTVLVIDSVIEESNFFKDNDDKHNIHVIAVVDEHVHVNQDKHERLFLDVMNDFLSTVNPSLLSFSFIIPHTINNGKHARCSEDAQSSSCFDSHLRWEDVVGSPKSSRTFADLSHFNQALTLRSLVDNGYDNSIQAFLLSKGIHCRVLFQDDVLNENEYNIASVFPQNFQHQWDSYKDPLFIANGFGHVLPPINLSSRNSSCMYQFDHHPHGVKVVDGGQVESFLEQAVNGREPVKIVNSSITNWEAIARYKDGNKGMSQFLADLNVTKFEGVKVSSHGRHFDADFKRSEMRNFSSLNNNLDYKVKNLSRTELLGLFNVPKTERERRSADGSPGNNPRSSQPLQPPSLVYFHRVTSTLQEYLQPFGNIFLNEEDRKLHKQYVWLSSKGSVTHLHFDQDFNLFIQLSGKKRFLLIPPTQSEHVFMFPRLHPLWHKSKVDGAADCLCQHHSFPSSPTPLTNSVDETCAEDVCKHAVVGVEREECSRGQRREGIPELYLREYQSAVRSFVVEVSAGEALYIPPYYWHAVETLTTPSISLSTLSHDNEVRDIMDSIYKLDHKFDLIAHPKGKAFALRLYIDLIVHELFGAHESVTHTYVNQLVYRRYHGLEGHFANNPSICTFQGHPNKIPTAQHVYGDCVTDSMFVGSKFAAIPQEEVMHILFDDYIEEITAEAVGAENVVSFFKYCFSTEDEYYLTSLGSPEHDIWDYYDKETEASKD
eukprot:m.35895 g.35895  ORF g.35895 m.35895 type:complete len:818 (+) comp10062_c0_seq3:95-2548(+)